MSSVGVQSTTCVSLSQALLCHFPHCIFIKSSDVSSPPIIRLQVPWPIWEQGLCLRSFSSTSIPRPVCLDTLLSVNGYLINEWKSETQKEGHWSKITCSNSYSMLGKDEKSLYILAIIQRSVWFTTYTRLVFSFPEISWVNILSYIMRHTKCCSHFTFMLYLSFNIVNPCRQGPCHILLTMSDHTKGIHTWDLIFRRTLWSSSLQK